MRNDISNLKYTIFYSTLKYDIFPENNYSTSFSFFDEVILQKRYQFNN